MLPRSVSKFETHWEASDAQGADLVAVVAGRPPPVLGPAPAESAAETPRLLPSPPRRRSRVQALMALILVSALAFLLGSPIHRAVSRLGESQPKQSSTSGLHKPPA